MEQSAIQSRWCTNESVTTYIDSLPETWCIHTTLIHIQNQCNHLLSLDIDGITIELC